MAEEVIKELGVVLKKQRNRHNLTQEQLAEETGISVKHIANIEKGITNGSFEIATILAKRLDFSLDRIVHISTYEDTEKTLLQLSTMLITCTKEQQEIAIEVLNTLIQGFKKMNNSNVKEDQ